MSGGPRTVGLLADAVKGSAASMGQPGYFLGLVRKDGWVETGAAAGWRQMDGFYFHSFSYPGRAS